jgi:hypothetical protein
MVMSASKGFDCCCRGCCDRGPYRGLLTQTRSGLGERASHRWVIDGVIVAVAVAVAVVVVEIDGRSDRVGRRERSAVVEMPAQPVWPPNFSSRV